MAPFLWWSVGIGCRNRCRRGAFHFRRECGRGGRDGYRQREYLEGGARGDRQTEDHTKGPLHRGRQIQGAIQSADELIRLEEINGRG